MNNKKPQSGYLIFQGASLVVPEEFSGFDSGNLFSAGKEAIYKTFGNLQEDDFFSIPSLENSSVINGVFLGEDFKLPSGYKAVPVRQILEMLTQKSFVEGTGIEGSLLRAFHIGQWKRESRFCGSCGNKNKDAENGEVARLCTVCGRLEYPRICPAVIVVITNEKDEALLAHNVKFNAGLYSLIAGFNEAGEDLESTVVREIMEEVGITVKDIKYVRSQPWPFPNSLMVGFSAVYSGGEIHCDGVEIEDARWFSKDNLPKLPGYGSVSRYLIELWINGKLK